MRPLAGRYLKYKLRRDKPAVDRANDKTPVTWGLNITLPLPPTPTTAMPGSEEKIAVMTWRAENGYAVFHPDDVVINEVEGLRLCLLKTGRRRMRMVPLCRGCHDSH